MLKAVIDRFEGEVAVLLIDDNVVNLPKKYLPLNTKEGDWVMINIELDTTQTKQRKQKVEDLLNKIVMKDNEL